VRHHGSRSNRGERQGSPSPSHASRGQPTRGAAAEEESALPAVVVGLGAIGKLVASFAVQHPELELVGAADEALAGTSLAELIPGAPDVPVAPNGSTAYRRARGGVAFICTGSLLEEVSTEIEAAVRAGLHVVSSCEELVNAGFVDPELADLIDRSARRSGVGVLGTGVNPGFILDRLPVTLGAVVGEVRRVEAVRVVDASSRRGALQEKLGLGLTPEEFETLVEEGAVGHIGLSESCALLVDGLGLEVDEVEEEIDPILAEERIVSGPWTIEPGRVRGLRQVALAFDEGREVARLTLELGLGLENPRDWFRIEADPPIEMLVPGGIEGDRATAWALINAAPRVASAEPGLLTVLDLPAGR